MRAYEALFYTYFRWARLLSLDRVPEHTAIFTITTVSVMNIGSILHIVEVLVGWRFSTLVHSQISLYGLGLGLYLANYLLLGTKRRLALISAKFEGEQPSRQLWKNVVAGLLAGETIIVFLVALWVV